MLKLAGLLCLLVLALCGIGFHGADPVFSQTKEHCNNEIKPEPVQLNDEDGNPTDSKEAKFQYLHSSLRPQPIGQSTYAAGMKSLTSK